MPRAIRRAAGVLRTRDALSTSAVSTGISASRAACSARASAARAALGPKASYRDSRNDQFVGGLPRRREATSGRTRRAPCSASSRRPIKSRRRIARLRACAALTRSPCASSVTRAASSDFRRPAEIPRDQGDFGLGDNASRAGHRLFRTERARRTSQQSLGANEIAELRHRDASQRQRWRVVAQGDALQCAEDIARGECARRGGDQRVHGNPVTLVTLTVRSAALFYHTKTNQCVVTRSQCHG